MSLHSSDPIQELRCHDVKVDVWLGSTTRAGDHGHAAARHAFAQLTHSSANRGHVVPLSTGYHVNFVRMTVAVNEMAIQIQLPNAWNVLRDRGRAEGGALTCLRPHPPAGRH